MRRATIVWQRRALRPGVSAGVVARRHAHRVLGVAARRLPRHPDRRRRDRQGRGGHARSRGRHAAAVVARRQDCCTSQRPHRHLEHLRVRHRRSHDVAGHERARRRVQPQPSPDGKRLAFIASVPKGGYDLFELPIDRTTLAAGARLLRRSSRRRSTSPTTKRRSRAPRPYRALETLAPQSWTLAARQPRSRSASIQTGGSDAVGLHGYSLARRPRLRARRRRTSARRTATSAGCPTLRVSRRRARCSSAVAGASTASASASPRRTGAATIVGRHSVRVAAELELDAVVRLRRRLVSGSSRRRLASMLDPNMRVPVHAADRLRAGRHRQRASRSRRCAA